MGAMVNNTTTSYVGWEEMVVSGEKGRREVHYYLKRSGGGRDLVVVGKEKSARHISYRYAIKDNKFLLSVLNSSSRLKLRSRREVVDWLDSILSGEQSNECHRQSRGGMENKLDTNILKDVQMQKLGENGAEFTWLGSSWTGRKKRRHFQSFCRNGAVISVQDFVYVLAEDDKRLVAYLEDMYEDTKGNKMVLVRWFHKIDEVGLVLPRNYNDREIFFSLSLQDLSIECIDGLATVLSPQHYEKFIAGARRCTTLMPFVCCRQFDSDDLKPFDVTRIKGYWKQEILKNNTTPLPELSDDDLKSRGFLGDASFRPSKRIRWSKECYLSPDRKENDETSLQVCSDSILDSKGDTKKMVDSKEDNKPSTKSGLYLNVGSQIEVLSQDSGIKGCWFRASIIKKHKDKVKVQYKDVKDAIDDSKNLEEWILPSRLAAPDAWGIRLSGRTIVRPTMLFDKGRVSGDVLNVGTTVDAWWHDGWWEGIVVKKESQDRINVHFPGEKNAAIFIPSDLRHSKEWFDNSWHNIKERPDLVSAFCGTTAVSEMPVESRDLQINNSNVSQVVRDLSKDYLVARLQWKSSGKRRRVRSPLHKVHFCTNNVETGLQTFEKLLVNSSLNFVDQEKCKYASDSHFSSSAVSSLTNLVMSR